MESANPGKDDYKTRVFTGARCPLGRQRHSGDFTGWKDRAQYQQAFARFLRDLKAERTSPDPS